MQFRESLLSVEPLKMWFGKTIRVVAGQIHDALSTSPRKVTTDTPLRGYPICRHDRALGCGINTKREWQPDVQNYKQSEPRGLVS
jgi:hypothetical protein